MVVNSGKQIGFGEADLFARALRSSKQKLRELCPKISKLCPIRRTFPKVQYGCTSGSTSSCIEIRRSEASEILTSTAHEQPGYAAATVGSPIFAAARSLARQFWSQNSILPGARRAAAEPGLWLALVRALAAWDPARAQSASGLTMSHGPWHKFRTIAGSHPAPDLHPCIQNFPADAWMRC